jgi:RNA polymerase sigma-70 factor (ECF subfamily)
MKMRATEPADSSRFEELSRITIAEAVKAGLPSLPAEAFRTFLASRLDDPVIDQERALDLYVACGCALGEVVWLKCFDERFLQQIKAAVRQITSDASFVDDATQRVRERLLVASAGAPPKIAEYSGHGSLNGFVRVVAGRTALNLLRSIRRDPPKAEFDTQVELKAVRLDPALEHIKRECRALFGEAFRQSMSELSDRDATVLRLHYLSGMADEDIAGIYRVHRATISRWVANARQTLLSATRERLAHSVQLTSTEVDDLMASAQSQLDVTFSTLMRTRR